KGHPARR
ncbi:hypothetical protein BN1723_018519, partial [Verticillium longisporum]